MAKPCTRTPADEYADALNRLEAANRELTNWRAHLQAAAEALHNPGHRHAAENSARIVYDLVAEATALTHQAGQRNRLSPCQGRTRSTGRSSTATRSGA